MNLKIRIAFLFSLFVFIILMISAVSIYLLNADFREEEFFKRVEIEAKEIAELYLKGQNSRAQVLREINQNALSGLPDEHAYIYDSSYHVLYATDSGYKRVVTPARFKTAEKNKQEYFKEGNRETVLVYVKGQGQPYYVLASAIDKYGHRKIEKLKIFLALSVLGGLLLSGLLAFFYVKQIIKPLENLQQQMQNISEQNLTQRVKVGKSNDEVSQIAKNFNDMLDRLEQAFEMRKNFVQHASHELRTPLANMLSQTEAALGKQLSLDNYREILQSLKEDQQDMISLVNALLILSQYEKITYLKDWTKIRIDEVLYDTVDVVKQQWPDVSVTIDFVEVPEKDDLLIIRGNEALVKSAILNLLKNASKYADDEKVKIIIDAKEAGITLLFENVGKQLLPEEQDRLFIPFFRGENSINKKGFGLGLSIVQRIINLHKGSIRYDALAGNINRFTVFFPHR
jgi:signal transduction histidine kinase